VVSTKAMTPTAAVIYGGVLNFVGAMIGTEVAMTIGKGLVKSDTITINTILCTVIAAITWNLITWYKGLPTSSSHAIIGSLLGATFFSSVLGWEAISGGAVMNKVVLPMVVSPLLGITIGFVLMLILTWCTKCRCINRTGCFQSYRSFPPDSWPLITGRTTRRNPWGLSRLP
jgi:inorganic phosphate transporter, PiT family